MDDQTLLKTVQNGLMVAGHEMGPVGDHWPAIHAISTGLEKEFEAMHRDEAVVGELEFHIANILRDIEEAVKEASPEERAKVLPVLKQAWDEYYAILEPVDANFAPRLEHLVENDDPRIVHMRAAENIIRSLSVRGGLR